MNLKSQVEKYLENETLFRERKNKDRGIVNLLMKKYPSLKHCIESDFISKETITAIVQDYASMDRSWRQSLEHNEHLRGKDYDDKKVLAQKKQIELGYEGGYHQNVKTLNKIS